MEVELKNPALSEPERKNKEAHLKTIENLLKTIRETKALYAKYGGRVIFQQAGPEPLDAYRDFLREQEKKGAFQIFGKEDETSFWQYFTDDAMHSFYSKEDGDKYMNTPTWQMGESSQN